MSVFCTLSNMTNRMESAGIHNRPDRMDVGRFLLPDSTNQLKAVQYFDNHNIVSIFTSSICQADLQPTLRSPSNL